MYVIRFLKVLLGIKELTTPKSGFDIEFCLKTGFLTKNILFYLKQLFSLTR